MGSRAQLNVSERLHLYELYLGGMPKQQIREKVRFLEDEGPEEEFSEVHPQTVNKVIHEFEQLKERLPRFPRAYSELLGGDASEYRKGRHLLQLYNLLQTWVDEIESAEQGGAQRLNDTLFCSVEIQNELLFNDLLYHLGDEVREKYERWKRAYPNRAEWFNLTTSLVDELKGRLLLTTLCPNCEA